MIRRLFQDARIGRSVRECAAGINLQKQFAGKAPIATFSWSTDAGEFEIIAVRKDVL